MSETHRDRSDPTDDRDFQQFTGAFDRPIAPAPSFAESLRQQVTQSSAAASVDHQPLSTELIAGGSPVVTLMDRRPRRIGFSILEIAAALLLISAVALSAYAINTVGRPIGSEDGDNTSRLAQGAASPTIGRPAETGSTEINWGGDSGRTWYFGDAEIDTSTPPLDVRVGDFDTRTVGPGLVVGDSWYGWTFRAGADAFLRVNVATGETVWEREYRGWGTLASDGQRIFAFLIDASDTPTPIPVAIDMTTGEIAWRGPAMHPFATQFGEGNDRGYLNMVWELNGPVMVGDTVFFPDGAGTTVALKAQDGSERWRYDRSAEFAGFAKDVPFPSGGTIVANDRYLFVTLPDGSIARLDPGGQELDRLLRGGSTVSDRHLTGMILRGDSLIVTTASSWVRSGSHGERFAALSVLDADTLEIRATTDITETSFSRGMVATDTAAFVYAQPESGGMQLYEIDLMTGEISEGFGGAPLAGFVQLSGAGDTLIATTSTGAVFYFSMETHELLASYRIEEPGQITLVGGPVQIADGQPILVWKEGDNNPAPQAPVATPAS